MPSLFRARPVRHWRLALTITSCFLMLLAACAPQPLAVTREPVSVRLVAAESGAPLADALAAAYEESHPWITVHTEVYNTTLAEGILRDGDADLALLSWIGQDSGLWSSPVASDGLAVIVHPATPLTDITLGLLQEIYRGRVQEWEGMVLAVVSREDGSGSRASFDATVLQGRDITLTAVVMPSNQAVAEHVARTPGSIGYVSTLRLGGAAASDVRVLPVDGVLPSPAAVDDGSYPLSCTIHLAAVGEPTGEGREFAQWALGPEGRAVIEAVRQTP
jgi:phosphate transport system substrate-binding protein